jgi:hypothetical protein
VLWEKISSPAPPAAEKKRTPAHDNYQRLPTVQAHSVPGKTFPDFGQQHDLDRFQE